MKTLALGLLANFAFGSQYGARTCLGSGAFNSTGFLNGENNGDGNWMTGSDNGSPRTLTAMNSPYTPMIYKVPGCLLGAADDVYVATIGGLSDNTGYLGVMAALTDASYDQVVSNTTYTWHIDGACSAATNNRSVFQVSADATSTAVSGLACAFTQVTHTYSNTGSPTSSLGSGDSRPMNQLAFVITTPNTTNVTGVYFTFGLLGCIDTNISNCNYATTRDLQSWFSGSAPLSGAVALTTSVINSFTTNQCGDAGSCTRSAAFQAVCTALNSPPAGGFPVTCPSPSPPPSSPAASLVASFVAVLFVLFF